MLRLRDESQSGASGFYGLGRHRDITGLDLRQSLYIVDVCRYNPYSHRGYDFRLDHIDDVASVAETFIAHCVVMIEPRDEASRASDETVK